MQVTYRDYTDIQRFDTLHTYAEWKRIENRRKAYKRAERIYYIKQKLSGLIMVIIGIVGMILIKEWMFLVFSLLGIALIFTKDKAMMF